MLARLPHRPRQLRRDPPVHQRALGHRRRGRRVVGVEPRGVRVRHEERVDVPQRQQELPDDLVEDLVADPSRLPRRSGGEHPPPQRICALALERLPRIEHVAEGFRHLPPVLGHEVPQAHDVAVGRGVEVQHALGHQRVEPTARLVDRLGDEVGGEEPLELVDAAAEVGLVAPLGERHRARVVPGVDHLGNPRRGLAAVRTREGDVVDEGLVRVDPGDVASGQLAQLGQRADRRLVALGTPPDRQRRAPVALARERPVDVVLEPVAEAAALDVLGHPVDRVVDAEQPVAERGRADVPGRAGVVEERRRAAPAERVRVLVRLHLQHHAALAEVLHDRAGRHPSRTCRGRTRGRAR